MEINNHPSDVKPQQIKADIVGAVVVVFLREQGKTKPVRRLARLTHAQQASVLNFVTHRCHGGTLQLSSSLEEQQRIITPP